MTELPAGTVTFLFTDIEGSTRLLHELGDRYADVLTHHRRLLREVFDQYSGREVDTQGDSFFVAFPDARDAVRAAAAAQRALAAHPWPREADVRVRMGIHTGEPLIAGEHYVGIDVHRGARIAAAAYGGQVLISARTSALVQGNGAGVNITLRELGAYPLKDLPEPERLYQLVVEGLPASFPPPRVDEKAPAAAGLPDYSLPPADVPCPYKGLVRFEPEDSELFFGREELVSELVARLEDSAFLAVVGPSGSGKSSLVRAGVVPALERREASIRPAIIEPGEHPLEQLIRTQDADLVVDQFEEVFTLCRDEEERSAFIDALLDAGEEGRRVIVVLRADFYGHCASYGRLAATLEDHQALIGPMTEEELRRAIERPAERAGLLLEPGLAEGILRDVVGEPGALPLLSHSLLETWKRRSNRMLTLLGYLQSGGVRGAIAKTAETVYREALTPEQKTLARNIFLRLTELGEGTEDTRRRVRVRELTPRREQAADVEEVLRVLVEARLVTTGEGTVEVAHEALIRHWPTLRAWLDEDREGRLVHRRLTEAAQEWETLGNDPGALYRGTRLAAATEWAELHDDELNELEREFLSTARKAELSDVEATRRRNRRLRVLVAALAVFLVGALAAGAFALVQRGTARESATRATVRELANAADVNVTVDPERSMLLALEAVERGGGLGGEPRQEATEALHRALQASRIRLRLAGHEGEVFGGAVSADGRKIATFGSDGTVRLWSAKTGRQLRELRTGGALPGLGLTVGLAFSPDGRRIVAPNGENATVWDVASGSELLTLEGHDGPVTAAVFSGSRQQIATAGEDGAVRIWDATSGRPVETIRVLPRTAPAPVTALAFSADGEWLVTGTASDPPAMVWDVDTGRRLLTLPHDDISAGTPGLVEPVHSVAISPDKTRIATGGRDTTTKVWDGKTGALLYTLYSHRSFVNGVDIDRTGTKLATASIDGTARVVELATGRELLRIAGHSSSLFGVRFTPDGKGLLTTSSDGTARVWDISPQGGREWLVLPMSSLVMAVAYSPDGSRIATGSGDGAVAMWDAETGKRIFETTRPETGVVVGGVIFSADGAMLAEGYFDGTVVWRDVATGAVRRMIRVPPPADPVGDRLAAISISADSSRLAVGRAAGGGALVYDLGTGEILFTAESDVVGVERKAVEFSPNGRLLGVAPGDGGAVVVDATTGARRYRLIGHAAPVQRIRFSPDGKLVITASNDGTVRVWDAASGHLEHVLEGHTSPVLGLAFSSDGHLLATASTDATVKVWSVSDLDAGPLTLTGHAAAAFDVSFSPDGTRLVSGSRDTTARVWAIRVEDLVDIARGRVTRRLTASECRQYLHADTCPSS